MTSEHILIHLDRPYWSLHEILNLKTQILKNQPHIFPTSLNNFQMEYQITGKSLSEALFLASTNPQYDNRLFIELQVQYMKIPSSNLGRTCCVQKLFLTFRTIFVHNIFSPCSAKKELLTKIYLYIDSYLKFMSWIYFHHPKYFCFVFCTKNWTH